MSGERNKKIPTLPVVLVVLVVLLYLLRSWGGVFLGIKEPVIDPNGQLVESVEQQGLVEKKGLLDFFKRGGKGEKKEVSGVVSSSVGTGVGTNSSGVMVNDDKYYREIDDNLGVGVLKEVKGFVKGKTVVVFPGEQLIQKALILGLPNGDFKFMVSGVVYSSISEGDLLNIVFREYLTGGETFYLVESVNKIEIDNI